MDTTSPVSQYQYINGVYCAGQAVASATFEQQYIAVRTKEARVYTDEMVAALPVTPRQHPAHKEWELRRASASKLLRFCREKEDTYILEIGCGNGWLSNLLASLDNAYVTGLDINVTELQQAARVFQKDNLSFVYDVFSASSLNGVLFSDIVFAASIQYFPFLKEVLDLALTKLQPGGHIHILDTFFYRSAEEQRSAALRTQAYYGALGCPSMSQHYFHHSYHDLAGYNHIIAYNPQAFLQKLKSKASPFPWIIIKSYN